MMRMKPSIFKVVSIALVVHATAALIGCATEQNKDAEMNVTSQPNGTKVEVTQNYNAFIDQYSRGETEYAGLYNNFEFKATLLNSEIRNGLIWKRGHYFQWNDAQISSEREKSNQEMTSETKVFMAFFTPNSKDDNLTDDKSIWRIYLDTNGRRYEGKPKRIRQNLSELQALYPYMTRWATPYEVTFAVPTAAIEGGPSKYTVTGPLGTKDVTFPAIH